MSLNISLKELIDNFSLFETWEEKYSYIIELGQQLPKFQEDLKTETALVPGCTSRVWLISAPQDDVYHFKADSDALIVKGLIAILFVAYDGQSKNAINSLDVDDIFKTIGLDHHLSPNRRNGFYAMVQKIKKDSGIV